MYDGGEFGKANGSVRFQEFEINRLLEVTPRMDNTPEEDKNFKIILASTASECLIMGVWLPLFQNKCLVFSSLLKKKTNYKMKLYMFILLYEISLL